MNAKELRTRAWNALKGRYWWALLAALVASVFGGLSLSAGSSTSHSASSGSLEESFKQLGSASQGIPKGVMVTLYLVLTGIFLLCLAASLVGPCIGLGYKRFNIDLFTDVEKPSMDLLFSRTKIFWKAVWLDLLCFLKIFAWTLLFIVPGIIAAISYSLAPYIMAQDPELSVKEAIERSKEMMKGNKWRSFCLDLSFIGWDLLAGLLPFLGQVLLRPYKEAANAAFFLDVSGKLNESHEDLASIEG